MGGVEVDEVEEDFCGGSQRWEVGVGGKEGLSRGEAGRGCIPMM